MNFRTITICLFLTIGTCPYVKAIPYLPQNQRHENHQNKIELFNNGNFENWSSQTIKESRIIGGHTINLMNLNGPWGSSNIWAKVSGVTKTNVSVYKDQHSGHGNCVKLLTHIVEAKVLGLINIKVLAAGSIFLGKMLQPIRDTKNPMAKMDAGIPFKKRPKAIVFDYKVKIINGNRIRQNGITRGKEIEGQDMADCILYLQKRWEDTNGNIFAKRVGTMVKHFNKSSDWKENASFTIHYGDITREKFYNSSWGLTSGSITKFAKNSRGEMVPIQEIGWADENETPTHIVLQFDSSHGGAYIGTVGNTLWVDNVKLAY